MDSALSLSNHPMITFPLRNMTARATRSWSAHLWKEIIRIEREIQSPINPHSYCRSLIARASLPHMCNPSLNQSSTVHTLNQSSTVHTLSQSLAASMLGPVGDGDEIWRHLVDNDRTPFPYHCILDGSRAIRRPSFLNLNSALLMSSEPNPLKSWPRLPPPHGEHSWINAQWKLDLRKLWNGQHWPFWVDITHSLRKHHEDFFQDLSLRTYIVS